MTERLPANDVLDVNVRIIRSFTGEIVGHFSQVGPNAWDEFEFVAGDGGCLDVLAGIEVQVEDAGTSIRMRYRGAVVRVAWKPSAAEAAEHAGEAPAAVFRASYLAPLPGETLLGAAALIARKLQDPPPNLDT